MATVIFDFDSTLVTCESLEEIARSKQVDAKKMQLIHEITNQAMAGEVNFLSSLKKRLNLLSLSREDFLNFGQRVHHYLTPGMAELIAALQTQGVAIWVVSGALREVILPLGKRLKIPEEQLLGIDLEWCPDGQIAGFNEELPINRSKWEGAQEFQTSWRYPRINIGDGMTDYALYEHGLVDHFIAFTQNVRRPALLEKRMAEANSVTKLSNQLKAIIERLC